MRGGKEGVLSGNGARHPEENATRREGTGRLRQFQSRGGEEIPEGKEE